MPELASLGPSVQTLSERSEDGCEVGERPDLGGQFVGALDGREHRLLVRRGQLVAATGFNQHAQEQVQKIQVFVRWLQRERIDGETGILQSDIQVRPAEDPRQHFIAATKIEDESQWVILLKRLKGERQTETLARPRCTKQ